MAETMTNTQERPTHVHICFFCTEQFECPIADCELTDDDEFICPECEDEEERLEEEQEEQDND